MNRKLKLSHNAKMVAVCGAAIYLAVGVTNVGTEGTVNQQSKFSIPSVIEASVTKEICTNTPKQFQNCDSKKKHIVIKKENFDDEESYLLAKIAMAEAEGEDIIGKALVIRVVLNRVQSNDFPDTIEEVIYQNWQFSPIENGRWDAVEPDANCWEALHMVESENWDESNGALYFESESDSVWHKENLEFLFKHGEHYFYK